MAVPVGQKEKDSLFLSDCVLWSRINGDKMNNKTILTLLTVMTLCGENSTYAEEMLQRRSDSMLTSCSDLTRSTQWAIGEVKYPKFSTFGSDFLVFGFKSSYVEIYDPDNCLQLSGPFLFKSQIKPADVHEVITASNDKGMKVVCDSKSVAQIRVHVASKKANGFIEGLPTSYKYTLPDWSYIDRQFPGKPAFQDKIDTDSVSCLNISINPK